MSVDPILAAYLVGILLMGVVIGLALAGIRQTKDDVGRFRDKE